MTGYYTYYDNKELRISRECALTSDEIDRISNLILSSYNNTSCQTSGVSVNRKLFLLLVFNLNRYSSTINVRRACRLIENRQMSLGAVKKKKKLSYLIRTVGMSISGNRFRGESRIFE